jgi:hypothetical protein
MSAMHGSPLDGMLELLESNGIGTFFLREMLPQLHFPSFFFPFLISLVKKSNNT